MRLITKCPSCQSALTISSLKCHECGLELKNDFDLSPFDRLNEDQYRFLWAFLRNRGNLKGVQAELQMSYPSAKKRLDDILLSLGIESTPSYAEEPVEIDVSHMMADRNSTKASEIIKAKLIESGGRAEIRLYNGEVREISAAPNGREFLCPQLIPFSFQVFDAIVDLLLKNPGYRARKGNARNHRLGEPGCEESTVAGAVLVFMGKKPGESGLDPVFILAAVLEWAGIARNGRGELSLTAEYRSLL